MIWLGIFIGLVFGAGGYYVYDKYFGAAKAEVEKIKAAL